MLGEQNRTRTCPLASGQMGHTTPPNYKESRQPGGTYEVTGDMAVS